jgi:GH15 family glucan-1,4-alpha-glucosidase
MESKIKEINIDFNPKQHRIILKELKRILNINRIRFPSSWSLVMNKDKINIREKIFIIHKSIYIINIMIKLKVLIVGDNHFNEEEKISIEHIDERFKGHVPRYKDEILNQSVNTQIDGSLITFSYVTYYDNKMMRENISEPIMKLYGSLPCCSKMNVKNLVSNYPHIKSASRKSGKEVSLGLDTSTKRIIWIIFIIILLSSIIGSL